jgi:ClpP class serine protease
MAVKNGLVDRVGSLYDALALAAKDGKISGPYHVLVYPHALSLTAIIRHRLGLQTELPTGLNILEQALPGADRKTMLEMSEILRLLRRNNVILAAPVGIVPP